MIDKLKPLDLVTAAAASQVIPFPCRGMLASCGDVLLFPLHVY